MSKSPNAVSILKKQLNNKEKEVKNRKIKILCYCDSPTVTTGFATVSKNILKRLHDSGKYEIVVWGINHYGLPYNHKEFPYDIYPAAYADPGDLYGRQAFISFMQTIDFDILWTLNDPSVMATFLPENIVKIRNENPAKIFQWIFYFPLDTEYLKRSWMAPIMTADYPVAYNKWAYNLLAEASPELKRKLKTIYHGIDEKIFFPIAKEEKEKFRKEYWNEMLDKDTFLVINVNRNQQRKDFYRTMKAFKLFKKERPNAHLYLHCKIDDVGGDLLEIAAQIGLVPAKDFSYPHPDKFHPSTGMPVEVLNKIYNVADLVMSTTLGEGCGLSSYEGLATKTPIIMANNTALSETLAEGRGIPVKSGSDENLWEVMPQDNSVVRPLTDVNDMAKELIKAYDDRDKLKKIADTGYQWIMERTWDKVCKDWLALFEEASQRVVSMQEGKTMPNVSDTDVGAVRS